MHRRRPAALAGERLGRCLDRDVVGEHDALVAEREAERRPGREPARGGVDRRAGRPEALGQALDPAPGRERADERHVGRHDEPGRDEQLAQGPARQQAGVGRDIAPPAPARDARGARRRVGRDDAEHTAGTQQGGAAADPVDRVVEMLDEVGEHHDVEARRVAVVGEVLEGELAHVEAERVAGVRRRRARELEAGRLVAAVARLVEQQPGAAADVEQPPGRDEAADEVEQAAVRRPAPGLLAEVRLVGHVAVEVVEGRALRQDGLLTDPHSTHASMSPWRPVAWAEGDSAAAVRGSPRPRTRSVKSPEQMRQASPEAMGLGTLAATLRSAWTCSRSSPPRTAPPSPTAARCRRRPRRRTRRSSPCAPSASTAAS